MSSSRQRLNRVTVAHQQLVQHVGSLTREHHILDLVFSTGDPSTKAAVDHRFPGSDHNVLDYRI